MEQRGRGGNDKRGRPERGRSDGGRPERGGSAAGGTGRAGTRTGGSTRRSSSPSGERRQRQSADRRAEGTQRDRQVRDDAARSRPAGPPRSERRPGDAQRPRRSSPEPPEPVVDDDVTGAELPREARAELRTASKSAADLVARHLVMAGRLIDDDPQTAYEHAAFARRRLPRLACVREAAGLCAYAVGRWAEALNDLRTYKRLTGSIEHLPVMADCERGLGRPERALALARGADSARLDAAAAVEMAIVAAGARRDLGQLDAAVVALQGPRLQRDRRDPWSARLFYAYADALLAAGRRDDAREWFVAAAVADIDGVTDAVERVDEVDSVGRAEADADAGDTSEPPDVRDALSARADEGQLLLVFEEPRES